MPYNYLIDPQARQSQKINLANTVVRLHFNNAALGLNLFRD